MTAPAHGLGWPGQPDQGGTAPGDDVPPRAEPPGGTQPTGLDPAFAEPGWGQPDAGAGSRGGEPGGVAAPASPEGLGWPTARPGDSAPVAEGFGTVGREVDREVLIPAVADSAPDTPIARAARAAVAARSGTVWPRPRACRVITIANQKGGVGKTTTAVNLAASLSMHGARVLVIDLDPQGNASTALDIDHRSGAASIYNVLVDGQPLAGVVRQVAGIPQLYCAPATIDLAGAEIELVPLVARESRLVRALAGFDSSGLDYIFIDCPPSLGLLTVNALVAAPEVLIPIQCEYYALEGLEQLLRTVDLVKSHLNPALTVSTILLTMYDGRTRLASQVADEVREHFGELVLTSIIPRSVRVSEAPSYGQSVMTYDPGSSGAQAYLEAAREMAYRNVPRP
jgi:chromosome partitioning protein